MTWEQSRAIASSKVNQLLLCGCPKCKEKRERASRNWNINADRNARVAKVIQHYKKLSGDGQGEDRVTCD